MYLLESPPKRFSQICTINDKLWKNTENYLKSIVFRYFDTSPKVSPWNFIWVYSFELFPYRMSIGVKRF